MKDAPFATDFEDLSLSVGVGADMHEVIVRVMYHQIVWRNAWFCCEKERKDLDDVQENEGFRPRRSGVGHSLRMVSHIRR